MKAEKRLRVENTIKHLTNLGYTVRECENGRLMVNSHIHFWATTGKWCDFKYDQWGLGLHQLLKYTGYFNRGVKNEQV